MGKMSDVDIVIRATIEENLDVLNSVSVRGEEIANPISFLQGVLLGDPTFCNIIPVPAKWIEDCLRDYQYVNEQGNVAYRLPEPYNTKQAVKELINCSIKLAWKELQAVPSYFERFVITEDEEERINRLSLHWQEQALTQGTPFDYSPRNAGYEDPKEEYDPSIEETLPSPFPTLSECEEEIRLAINEHPF